jgi:hypothetical protein
VSGPAPKQTRRRRTAPALGEWQAAPGIGWQHGPIPEPPDGMLAASREAWTTWMQSWFASHWTKADLPGLLIVITAYDAVKRQNPAKANDLTALLRAMDNYGITPAGQQSRRWQAPKDEEPAAPATVPGGRYAHLRSVG